MVVVGRDYMHRRRKVRGAERGCGEGDEGVLGGRI